VVFNVDTLYGKVSHYMMWYSTWLNYIE